MKHIIGVYGSLREGSYYHHYLSGAEFLGFAGLSLPYLMYDIGYPSLVPDDSLHEVALEFYRVDDEILARVDKLEECPDEYSRETISGLPFLESIGIKEFYIYIYRHGAKGRLIESGDFSDSPHFQVDLNQSET